MNYRILCWVLPFIMLFSASSVFSAGSYSDDSSSSADSLDVNYLNGKEQVANQDYQAAIRYLLKAVETDSENADVYNLLGYSHRNLEMNDKAFVYYEKALSLDPRHKGAHEYIGELYLKLKQPEKAKEHLAKLDSNLYTPNCFVSVPIQQCGVWCIVSWQNLPNSSGLSGKDS